ncbi:ribosome silencing factor [Trueperella pecoris]|uniref:Ribosomal silencing factor RsfS n=1 Tax=Trueperella pecoris TaxID=2733571 RepID=A0A7M1QSQ0_9ACTO|nr:ribosome silencing factor [Trueperella pecoris]QOQ38620.1 ribosome silencing factor [Trueperella pecoris]QOR44886.1 ribosome silencing factor [Trueperella pecoris]QTG74796.1 ribosome silencing factor [Trueperella pecoris]
MAATPESIEQTFIAARAASEGKATSITAIDVSERLVITDVFLVVSGSSERQVRALVDDVEEAMHKAGSKRLRREGLEGEAHWVLLDFGNVMVHVQQDEDREFYALEKLWGDCPIIELPEDITVDEGNESSLAAYFASASEDGDGRPEGEA